MRNFTRQIQNIGQKSGAYLARGDVLFYALPWLMVLIVIGTITQKDLGLYVAVQKYISSYITFLGPVPVPGGLSVIALISLALCVKFIFYSEWKFQKAGIHLSHLGIILLLIGGLITASTAREGFMIIPEGDSADFYSDYQNRVLVFKHSNKEKETVFDFSKLEKNQVISQAINKDELSLKILDICDNCDAQAPSGKYLNLKGLAQNMELFSVPPRKNIEENFSGLIFEILNAPNEDDLGTYIVMEDIPRVPEFEIGDEKISINLIREKTQLPFSIALSDFRKIDYPGTQKAQEFESDIVVQDKEILWPVKISMNEPLRYKGYSFYQSSFTQIEGQEVTVLSVVKNSGWLLPYVSTLVIFAGLLLHIIIRLGAKREEKT